MKFLNFGLKRSEAAWMLGIVIVIMIATFANLQISLRRSRDAQRKDDARTIANAIEAFKNETAYYPASDNGLVVACNAQLNDKDKTYTYKSCQWDEAIVGPLTGETYLEKQPLDPHYNNGARYVFISDGKAFLVLAHLEGDDEPEYSTQIEQKNLLCGSKPCNFGIGSDTKFSNF